MVCTMALKFLTENLNVDMLVARLLPHAGVSDHNSLGDDLRLNYIHLFFILRDGCNAAN